MLIVLNYSCTNTVNSDSLTSNETSSLNEVIIGNQIWMKNNLNVSVFCNGDSIPEAKTDSEWDYAINNGKPAWCYYNNNPDNGKKFGKLYNLYAISDKRGLAPKGWKIPSDNDWIYLADFLGGSGIAGNKLKSKEYWVNNNCSTYYMLNENQFTGLPCGTRFSIRFRYENGIIYDLLNENGYKSDHFFIGINYFTIWASFNSSIPYKYIVYNYWDQNMGVRKADEIYTTKVDTSLFKQKELIEFNLTQNTYNCFIVENKTGHLINSKANFALGYSVRCLRIK